MEEQRCIAFVGAGGKTSAIYSCARQFINKNFAGSGNFYQNDFSLNGILGSRIENITSILIVTTTKMYLPDREWENYTVLDGSSEEIIAKLAEKGVCIAGTTNAASPGKLHPLEPAQYQEVVPWAGVVLVEGDGSHQLPLKFPSAKEPVYPPQLTDVVIVTGLAALGQPFACVCHRKELAQRELQIPQDKKVTGRIIYRIIREGYIKPLRQRKERPLLFCVLNQMDVAVEKKEAAILIEMLQKEQIHQVFTGFFK